MASKWEETVMGDRETVALLRGMPYLPSNEAGWMNFVRRCLLAQAEITWHARDKEVEEARKQGRKDVVEKLQEYIDNNNVYRVEFGHYEPPLNTKWTPLQTHRVNIMEVFNENSHGISKGI